eukprot:1153844-Pelagomonas_calceolata.AAC.6
MEVRSHLSFLGIIFGPGDGSFKEEIILTLLVHPGITASGLGIRWKTDPGLNARGSHAISCLGLSLRRRSAFAIEDLFVGKGCWAWRTGSRSGKGEGARFEAGAVDDITV